MAIAEDLAIIHEPDVEDAFRVEQHGIDYIPESERWATPRDIFGMWAGASVQIEYFIYGAILMTFGLTFAQVLIVIVLGNLSYFLLGLCSLQGPNAGTTVFAINRAPFGPNGSRPISVFNWLTQSGFEVEGLILIVGAGLVLMIKAGYLPGSPAKKQSVLELTSRETEVAHLVGKGLSNPEIAAELFISRKAVEYHLGNVYAKCGLQGRQQLRRFVEQWAQPAAV